MNDTTQSGWTGKKCRPCEAGMPPMDAAAAGRHLDEIEGWELNGGVIERTFTFKDYYETMAFANAMAWVAHRQDHHPDVEIDYKTCRVRYTTHAIGGLSDNDFICAARINALLT